jgi:hypothetical protein
VCTIPPMKVLILFKINNLKLIQIIKSIENILFYQNKYNKTPES